MTTALLTIAVLSSLGTPATTNDRCQISDEIKRPFEDLRPIEIDADGDGQTDRVIPRTFTTRATHPHKRPGRARARWIHWITFDLKTAKGRTVRGFFKFDYGSNIADYWIYALLPCDVNQDGRMDLIFYTGDDETDDTVVLINKQGRFIVKSRKHSEGDSEGLETRSVRDRIIVRVDELER